MITNQNIITANKLRTVINVYICVKRLFLRTVMSDSLALKAVEISLILT